MLKNSAKLLVSVRNATEAEAALAGGADLIDIKEPRRGSLGAADHAVVKEICDRVAGRRPVSAACGELLDAARTNLVSLAEEGGLAMLKLGLANCRGSQSWREELSRLRDLLPVDCVLVPVGYADYPAAISPEPAELLDACQELSLGWMMVDTFDKAAGDLFDAFEAGRLTRLASSAHESGIKIAVAGRLRAERLAEAATLGADVVGVRGAVCPRGRLSSVEARLVASARELISPRPVTAL